jgi:hypothetical protein
MKKDLELERKVMEFILMERGWELDRGKLDWYIKIKSEKLGRKVLVEDMLKDGLM